MPAPLCEQSLDFPLFDPDLLTMIHHLDEI
jgi:hypothetical protein